MMSHHHHHQPVKSPEVMFLHEMTSVQQWQREQTLGSGSFATITLWVNTETNDRMALKQYRNQFGAMGHHQQTHYERWLQEVKMMKQIKCENIVNALPLPKEFESLKIKTSILAMEFCNGGDLRRTLNRPENCCGLPEKEIRQILSQISSAIIYLHELKIVHRDLKPENIVLQPLPYGKILYKLTDLGYAKQFSDTVTAANSFVGTYEYLAPELFRGISHTSAVDNWSFGLMAFEIITGNRPFLPNHPIATVLNELEKKTSRDICTEINLDGGYHFSSKIPYSNRICNTLKIDLEEWLRIVLEYDPSKRGGSEALKMIKKIMKKFTVQVFSIDTHDLYSFHINRETNRDELKQNIFDSTKVPPENQYLFFRNGIKPEMKIGKQIIDTWYTPDDWFERYQPIVIFMFDYSKKPEFQEFYKTLELPPLVERILLDPTVESSYEEVHRTSRDSVFVIQQSIQRYSLLHEAFKSCILNSMSRFNELQDENQTLYFSTNESFTSINILKQFIDSNYYLLMDNENFEYLKIEEFVSIYSKLKDLYQFRREKILKHFEKTKHIIPKLPKEKFIFEDFFQSCEIDQKLSKKFLEIQSLYELIRKQKKDEFNKHKNSLNQRTVDMLVGCFKLIQTLMSDIFSILSLLIEFIKQIDRLRKETRLFQMKVDQIKTEDLEELNRFVMDNTTATLVTTTCDHHHHHQPNGITNGATIKKPVTKNEEIFLELKQEEQRSRTQQRIDFKKLEFCNFLF